MYMVGHHLSEKINFFSLHLNQSRKLLVSNFLVKKTEIVEILETYYKFDLFERNYSQISLFSRIDILIDHRTGCLVLNTFDDYKVIGETLRHLQNIIKDLVVIFLASGQKLDSSYDENLVKMVKLCSLAKTRSRLKIKLLFLEDLSSFGNIIQNLYIDAKQKIYNTTE